MAWRSSSRQTKALAAELDMTDVTGPALQAVPMDRLLAATKAIADPFRPVLDGRSFQRDPYDLTAPSIAEDIPLMIGNAATETTLFLAADMSNFTLDAAEVERRMARDLQLDEPHTKRVIDVYRAALRDATPSELLAAIATDYMYRRNTTRVAELQARQASCAGLCVCLRLEDAGAGRCRAVAAYAGGTVRFRNDRRRGGHWSVLVPISRSWSATSCRVGHFLRVGACLRRRVG